MKTFFIPIEVQKREFDGKSLLAAMSALKGYQVVLGWDLEIFSLLNHAVDTGQKLPGVLLYNGLYDAEYSQLYRYRQAGAVIMAMPEEQLSTGAWKVSTRTLDLAHSLLFWGTEIEKRFVGVLPQIYLKSKIVGSLQYDPLRIPFLAINERRARALKEKFCSFILILPYPFFSLIEDKSTLAFNIASAEQYGYEVNNIFKQPEKIEQQKKYFINLINRIRDNFPKMKIIIRPHPSDEQKFWEHLCEPFEDIIIDKSGNAIPWFMASEMMIQIGSSVGHQALFLQHPQIYFAPTYTKDTGYAESLLFKNFFCRHEDEIIALMQKYLQKGYSVDADSQERLETFYANVSGPLACERILEILDKIDWKAEVYNTMLPNFVEGGRRVTLSFPPGRLEKKFQGIFLEDIQEQLNIYAEYIPDVRNIFIRQIGDNTFVFSLNPDELSLCYTSSWLQKIWNKVRGKLSYLRNFCCLQIRRIRRKDI